MNIVHKPRDDRLSHPFRIATRKTAAATSTRSCNCCYVTHLSKENINYAEILARYMRHGFIIIFENDYFIIMNSLMVLL